MFTFTYDEQLAKQAFSAPEPIPTGTYLLRVKDTKLELTNNAKKNNTGEKKFVITFVVEDENSVYKGRVVTHNLNVINNSQEAVERARKELHAIGGVLKVYQFADTNNDDDAGYEFRGKYLRADIVYEDDGKYKSNKIVAVYDTSGMKPGESVVSNAPRHAPVVSTQVPAPVIAPAFAAPQSFSPPVAQAQPVPAMPQAPAYPSNAPNPFQPQTPTQPVAWQPPSA